MNKEFLDIANQYLYCDNSNIEMKNLIEYYLNTIQLDKLTSLSQIKRENTVGNSLYVRASIEYSNKCKNHCKFCGMSLKNLSLLRYEISFEAAKREIDNIRRLPISNIHLVGGESHDINWNNVIEIIKYATQCGFNVTIVLGEQDCDIYNKLYEAGARRYILKFETSNPRLYNVYKSDKSLTNRIAHLLILRDIGYKIGSGIIVGLPNTDLIDLVNDIILLLKLKPDMVSASCFMPNQASELYSEQPGNFEMLLRIISIYRILFDNNPMISCSSAGGLERQIDILNAGANVISTHITPPCYANNFSMYSDKRIVTQFDSIKYIAEKTNMRIAEYI